MNAISINVQGLGDLEKRRWLNKLCFKHNVNFLEIQETKLVHLELWVIRQVWGNIFFDFACSSSRDRFGGILYICNKLLFQKTKVFSTEFFCCY